MYYIWTLLTEDECEYELDASICEDVVAWMLSRILLRSDKFVLLVASSSFKQLSSRSRILAMAGSRK